jgi:hypothetical protein
MTKGFSVIVCAKSVSVNFMGARMVEVFSGAWFQAEGVILFSRSAV